MGVVENNKYSYIKISQLILTGSRGKSALLIPTTNLHYHKRGNAESKAHDRSGDDHGKGKRGDNNADGNPFAGVRAERFFVKLIEGWVGVLSFDDLCQ